MSARNIPFGVAVSLALFVAPVTSPAALAEVTATTEPTAKIPVGGAEQVPIDAQQFSEDAICELEGAADGSLQEFYNRKRATEIAEGWRASGLTETEAGRQTIELATQLSGCEPVDIGGNACETLDNHRYSSVDLECREILLFEEDRLKPLSLKAPNADVALTWALTAVLEQQVGKTVPTLTRNGLTREIDPGLAGWKTELAKKIAKELAIDVFVALVIEAGKEAYKEVKDASIELKNSAYEQLEASKWNSEASLVIPKNFIDLSSIKNSRASIEVLDKWKAAEKAEFDAAVKQISANVESGKLTEAEARAEKELQTQRLERKLTDIDIQIAEQESNIAEKAKTVTTRSEEVLNKKDAQPEDICNLQDCPEFEVNVRANEKYLGDLKFCRARYQIDVQAHTGGVAAPDTGLQSFSKAQEPKCNLERFERITSAFRDSVMTLEEAFGAAGAFAAQSDETALGSRDPEEALADAIREHETACKTDPNTCECQNANRKLDRAMARRYTVRDTQQELIDAYGLKVGAASEPPVPEAAAANDGEGSGVKYGPAYSCSENAILIFVKDVDGNSLVRFVQPDEPGYPDWAVPLFICDNLKVRNARYNWALGTKITSKTLGAPPAPSLDNVKKMIEKGEPIGSELLTKRLEGISPSQDCDATSITSPELPAVLKPAPTSGTPIAPIPKP